jgi:NADPH:quinone reductase-like Zn-dependent oxidoreductase
MLAPWRALLAPRWRWLDAARRAMMQIAARKAFPAALERLNRPLAIPSPFRLKEYLIMPAHKMKAVLVPQYGAPSVLSLQEIDPPVCKPGEVLVRVKAAGVNPFDCKMRSGALKDFYPIALPFIPGSDFAGTVEAVGSGVKRYSIGDDVFGAAGTGTYAQLVAVKEEILATKPTALDYGEAASVPVAALTAWQALFQHGQLKAGQTVLVHGGAGGVGMFAVQLARWAGARVVATASASATAAVREYGADAVIDYRAKPFEQVVHDVDLVLDTQGGQTQERSLGVLKRGGRLVSTVSPPDEQKASAAGVTAKVMGMKSNGKDLAEIARHIESGVLKLHVAHTFALSEAAEAQELLEGGHVHGKIVLEIE